jgi:ribosome-binding protein aMBF1 (putative translation factor)
MADPPKRPAGSSPVSTVHSDTPGAAATLAAREVIEMRRRLGWSQESLARAADAPLSDVSRLERGGSAIPEPIIDRITEALFSDHADPSAV